LNENDIKIEVILFVVPSQLIRKAEYKNIVFCNFHHLCYLKGV